jgi:UDP:flavonoid glycosyltransferase YjiC (YdhE family)
MSRFLVATVPVPGHINPGLPIVRALVKRRHEVCWYTGQRFRATVEATGAHFLPMSTPPDYNASDLDAAFPGRKGLTGLAGMKWDIKHIFIDAIPHQVADLRAILRLFPADAILADPGLMGAAVLNELGGPPYANYGISALTLSSRDTAPFGLALPPDSSPLGRLRNRVLHTLFQRVLFRDVQTHANAACWIAFRRFCTSKAARPLSNTPAATCRRRCISSGR